MENSMNDRWFEIVGFPNYRMNPNTFEVKNVLTNHILRKNKDNMFLLTSNRTLYRISYPRLLFCVINNIPPKEVSANAIIVMENDKPVVYDRGMYLHKKKKECKKSRMNDINPLQAYKEDRDFIDKVIVSLETGNMNPVLEEIYRYTDNVIWYLLKQRLVCNKDAAREIASCSLEITIERILSGEVISRPLSYIKGVARILVREIRCEKWKKKTYFDNVAIRG